LGPIYAMVLLNAMVLIFFIHLFTNIWKLSLPFKGRVGMGMGMGI
jgi:hypothetical protein